MATPKAEFVVSAVDRASAVMQKIGGNMSKLGDGMGARWDSVGASLAKTAAGLYVLERAATGLFRFADSAVEATDKIGDYAKIADVASGYVQVFAQMNEKAGGSLDGAAEALIKFRKAKQIALTKGGVELEAFQAAGITIDDLRKKKPEELLMKMADAFNVSNDAGLKLNIVHKLMGKGATSMVGVLNEGASKIKNTYAELEDSGALLKEAQTGIADKAEESFIRMKKTFGGLKTMIGLKLAEKLIPIVDAIQQWVVANRGLISQKLDVFMAHLPAIIEGVTTAFKVLWFVGSLIFSVFEKVSHVLGAKLTGGLVGIIILIPLIAGVIGVVGSLFTALSTIMGVFVGLYKSIRLVMGIMRIGLLMGRLMIQVYGSGLVAALARFATAGIGVVMKAMRGLFAFMMANPFVLLIAGIVLAAVLIYINWDAIVAYVTKAWERIKAVFDAQGFFGALWQGVLEIFQASLNIIIAGIKSIPGLGDLIPKDFTVDFADRNAQALTAGKVAQAQQQKFAGTIAIEIKGDKKAKVTEMKTDRPGIEMNARHGPAGAPG